MHKLLIASLVMFGCGKKKDEGGAASNKPADKPAEPATAPATAPPAAEAPPKPSEPEKSYGTCRVTASGGATFDQTSQHTGGGMLNVFQWHTPEVRKKFGYSDEGIILNCLGKDARINLLSGRRPFPTQTATYPLGAGGLNLIGTFNAGSENVSIMKSEGSLEITAFDSKRIAGKGKVTVSTLPKIEKPVELTIEFDLECHGLSACPQ